MKNIPELLVPASDLNTLKYAVEYGADAIYIGGKNFNLRSLGQNFTISQIREAAEYVHQKNCKIYLAVNAVIFESEIKKLRDYLEEIKSIDIDGYIISDSGVLDMIKEINREAKVHISTQANVTNHAGVNFYAKNGASRVNIAREIKFEDLKKIISNSKAEIEVFVHGALCISYSGRCMLSKYMAGRDANKGKCAHSCRWNYFLMEESRPNLFYNIIQDDKGTHIYNSRDLCLLEKLQDLVDAGVSSLKIEGRMKTENYVSQVTWVYRSALDYIRKGEYTPERVSYLLEEVKKASHRDFTLGFMFLDDYRELEENDEVGYIKKYSFIGVMEKDMVRVKNQFRRGDTLEVLTPGCLPFEKKVEVLKVLRKGEFLDADVANPNDLVNIEGLEGLNEFSIIRVKQS
jgi:U32 family peptidase